MDIEVLWDPQAYEIESNLVLDAERHQILPDGVWIEWARRVTKRSRLFIYYHRWTGNFVLCEWLFAPGETDRPVAIELDTYPCPPDWGPGQWPSEDMLKVRMRGQAYEVDDLVRKERDHARARRHDLETRAADRNSKADWLRHQGKNALAASIASTPLAQWDPTPDESTDRLLTAAAGRIITHG